MRLKDSAIIAVCLTTAQSRKLVEVDNAILKNSPLSYRPDFAFLEQDTCNAYPTTPTAASVAAAADVVDCLYEGREFVSRVPDANDKQTSTVKVGTKDESGQWTVDANNDLVLTDFQLDRVQDHPVYYDDSTSFYRVPKWMLNDDPNSVWPVDNNNNPVVFTNQQKRRFIPTHPYNDNLQVGSESNTNTLESTWKNKPELPTDDDAAFHSSNKDVYQSAAIWLDNLEFASSNPTKEKSLLQSVRDYYRSELGVNAETPFQLNFFGNNDKAHKYDPWHTISDFWYRDGYLFAWIPTDSIADAMGVKAHGLTIKKDNANLMDAQSQNELTNNLGWNPKLISQLSTPEGANLIKSNGILRHLIEEIVIESESGKDYVKFQKEKNHLEYFRGFCRKMGGELWAPASQAEYEDIVERKDGVCERARNYDGTTRSSLVDNQQKSTKFYLNLHRDGYMRVPLKNRNGQPSANRDARFESDLGINPSESRTTAEWEDDNSGFIAGVNSDYQRSTWEPSRRRSYIKVPNTDWSRARFYTGSTFKNISSNCS